MRAYFLAGNPKQVNNPKQNYTNEQPLIAELYSADQMDHCAKTLAGTHKLSKTPSKGILLYRLADNEKVLNAMRKLLAEVIKKNSPITPAGEWLIDNFYFIEEQIRTAKKHLPKGYNETLPQLTNAETPGIARVYDIALQLIAHSDGKVDLERLGNFINSYQSVVPLKLGELWAIPIMLRLTLIENLRRVSSLVAIDRIDKNLADHWVQQMTDTAQDDPKSLILVIADMTRSAPPMVSAFVSEMSRQLLGKGVALALPLTWIEQRLTEEGRTIAELVNAEIQKQAVNQVSVSNSIGSLRLLSSFNWRDFIEKHSIVEQTLREDYDGIYARMDFHTRDNYRHVVEYISRKSKHSENDIAKIAIKLASENIQNKLPADRKAHVGYYLTGKGFSRTKKVAGIRNSGLDVISSVWSNNRLPVYIGSIILITIAISTVFLIKAYSDTTGRWMLLLLGILLMLASSQLAISVVNFFSTLLVRPNLLPRMDFSEKIPDDYSTLVIIPAMLTHASAIEDLVEALEVRFLANRDENLYFGLLTDFTDAAEETLPADIELLQLAQKKIRDLKIKYENGKRDIFFLFHRPRQWNAGENIWMGYERKRGKLSELNHLLRSNTNDHFSCIVGEYSLLYNVKYIITLDSDTQLPRGAAWKMVATMAHPLNHPFYDERKKRVTDGYGILQPRVSVTLPESNSSYYSRLHGNEPGIDPYTRATSDVYQDLFAQGSFIGKGIYELDTFEKTLKGRFLENRILSHDLLEGCFIRSGLISDVELFEKYPMSYRIDTKRRLRWVRGDWQIFSWCLPFARGVDGRLQKNPLSGLSRWKIFDNIRRSLISMALTTLIILGWTVLCAPLFWTIAVSGIIVFPIFVTLVWDTFKKPEDVILSHHIKRILNTTGNIIIQTSFSVLCLPFEAFANLFAIARTSWRMLLSHKKLLEWDQSSNLESINKNSLAASYWTMRAAPVLSFVLIIYLAVYLPEHLYIAGAILFFWAFSPLITWLISNPSPKQKTLLTAGQNIFLLKVARKTWGYFERFVGDDDNWLPPDNFQQYPVPVIAHRTSPTNIGLSLLANLSALDFGYITTGKFLERTDNTIKTMLQLERFNGHFFNWYDTRTLQVLPQKYISTVDSGNLAGHLLTLRQGLFEILHKKVADNKIFEGLLDTIRVLKEIIGKQDSTVLFDFYSLLEIECSIKHTSIDDIINSLKLLSVNYEVVIKTIETEAGSITDWWMDNLSEQLRQAIDNIQILYPWYALPPVSAKFRNLIEIASDITLSSLFKKTIELIPILDGLKSENNTIEENEWISTFKESVAKTQQLVGQQIALIEKLGHECIGLADMEWDFLYDKPKHLLTIGYRVEEHACDPGYYDLLASEARLCVFVAIAQGKLPEESWFALGRLLTNVGGDSILLSWSGSMFEYLMPLLVMPLYENTLLGQTCKTTVKRQIDYGKHRGIPWGFSESGYNMVDASSNYQYQAFGVPGLGLKRGLEIDTVVAPYAIALSLMVAPEVSCENLESLFDAGFEGDYGFYEAIDYTPSRLQRGQSNVVIQSFMAHHQGMSLLSLAYLILDQPMQRRFEAEPQFQATLLLLQERIPKSSSYYAHTTDLIDLNNTVSGSQVRIINTPNTQIPEVQLLSNGKYHVMVTNSGGGYSRWKDIAVTRWREDSTCDNWGTFCYIRDMETGEYWSNTHQPVLKKMKSYEVAFSMGRVDFHNSYDNIETHTEIVISPEDDTEMRRMVLTNKSRIQRTIEITTYAEVVLSSQDSDAMQPAFSNLFVQTEILPFQQAILCKRKPRSAYEHTPWMFHAMVIHGMEQQQPSFETDRMEFIGRGNTVFNPKALNNPGPLSGSQGSVLDPIVAIRNVILLEPEESVTIDLIIGIGDTKEVCEKLIEKYHDKHNKERVFELAWTHSQVILRQINVTEADEQLFGRLAGSLIFTNPALRADPSIIIKNRRGQSGLWGYSISGDLPIILLQIEDQKNIQLARQLIQAHTYWRLKGLIIDLVIWNEDHGGYRQAFQNEIQALIPNEMMDKPGGIFVRAAEQISNEDRILFQTVARVNIADNKGSLSDQLNQKMNIKPAIVYIPQTYTQTSVIKSLVTPANVLFFNGKGGFSADAREYVILLDNKNRTPTPWANVIANPDFGTVVSESGQAYTWIDNAHEMRLTPWNNDPVTDSGGEVFYIRDDDTGSFWSATALPRGGRSSYITKHGFGYSIFEHIEEGIHSEMTVYVDKDAPVKFTVLKIRNYSGAIRRLSVTGYTEWVLGDLKPKTAMHIYTEIEPVSAAFLAKNPYFTEFDGRVAFFDTDDVTKTFTGDRTEFIGRNGNLQNPDAMHRLKLSGKVGVALDPCAAIQVPFTLLNGEEREVIFRLGAGKDVNKAIEIINQSRGHDAAYQSLENVKEFWKHTTSALQVETPDKAINVIANGWLTYQTLSCRLWGRSGYYQSGGAFGFRDQLQDVLSLLHAEPLLARKQILLCASRQFREGDVQHWWHPPTGRGVRTHISDDYLWLPYVTQRYVSHTGDIQILAETSHYLSGRLLNPGEDSYYGLPDQSDQSATLYEHCLMSIKHGLNFGVNGLPLMGAGDWNDGMDRVGHDGKGESVWLGFFLYNILVKFIEISNLHHDPDFAAQCKTEAATLGMNLEKNGWDGAWYRRAYFDDGTPLGSADAAECQIDSIAQSWSVISGAGSRERSVMAMEAVAARLVKKDANIIQLLDPPFDKATTDPGYIKGYVPGVRENGGQYTHAAVWTVMAFAKLGDNSRTWELLQMLNPVNHGRTREEIATYKVEPYVVAADIYSYPPHAGRGGWTWYTGSASWMYQLIIESFLGLRTKGDQLTFEPCIPPHWALYKAHYRYRNTMYHIILNQKNIVGKMTVTVDGTLQIDNVVTLRDNGVEHRVEVELFFGK